MVEREAEKWRRCLASVVAVVILCSCSSTPPHNGAAASATSTPHMAQHHNPGVKCFEDSPERRGEEGCTILANRPLSGSVATPLYWHIDRFDSLEAAKTVASPDSVAAEAHGGVWLMTVEAETAEHRGGRHVAAIGPLALSASARYSMRVQSSLLMPGSTSPVHTHPGPEVLYVVDGEQCTETPDGSKRIGAGESYVVPSGGVHRARVIGSVPRRILGLNLYDSSRPTSHDLADPPALPPCR
jgi:quercetin dioxygenase-like cupin family protein